MENATKALLIAGSVLIAIVLIAVGIKILGSTSGVTEQVGQVSNSLEASIFNSQYTQYEGIQKGSEVKALYRLVNQNNNTSKRKIKMWAGSANDDMKTWIEEGKILSNKKYNVNVKDGDNDGFIDNIYVTETTTT